MYHRLLSGLFAKSGITDPAERVRYLADLQQPMTRIRDAYDNLPVRFDYSDHRVQAAYLLAYVPHYTQMLWRVLGTTNSDFANELIDELVCIGCGPCPEIIGLLNYFVDQAPRTERQIKVSVHDIAVDSWAWSRDIVFEQLVPGFSSFSVEVVAESRVDLSEPFSLDMGLGKKFVVLQNCLCELDVGAHPTVEQNLIGLAESLAEGSYLALMDIPFPGVRNLISRTESTLAGDLGYSIVRGIDRGSMRFQSTQARVPSILEQHLLTGDDGLIPRRNLNFDYTLLKKKVYN